MKPIPIEEKLQNIFDDNENYFSSYTGTPMLMPDKAIPKIMKILQVELAAKEVERLEKEVVRLKELIEKAYIDGYRFSGSRLPLSEKLKNFKTENNLNGK